MRNMLLKLASERIGTARHVLLAAVLALASGCGAKPVTSVATEADAIEILDVLGQSGLEAGKREIGEGETRRWEIVIDEDFFGGGNVALAVQVLRDHGLPRPEETVGEDGGLIPSERAEKLREQRRIRADIERQLRALPGVTLALVTVVMPQDPTLELNPYPATASVVINYKDERPAFNEQQIQNLVAKGVPNLKPGDVSVTMSQQTPRPVPERELAARRRNNILLAAAVGLFLILGSLLVVLYLRTRRQRAELDGLREGAPAPDEFEEDAARPDRPAEQPAGRLEA
jgi:type III secretory pathway lipoprotein EscJ